MDYLPTVQQPLLFSVYDIDSRSMDLRHHDFVGSVEVKLDALLGQNLELHTTTKTLRVAGDPKSRGLIHVTAEVIKTTRGKVQMHVAGQALSKVGILRRKPDAFLEIGRQISSLEFQPVFRTEVAAKTKHPWWRPFDLTIQRMCNDDWDRPIQFSCWNVSYGSGFSKTFDLIGRCEISLRQMTALPSEGHYRSLELTSPRRERQNKKSATVGTLRFYQFITDMQYSLLDYIRGGCRLRLVTAIDFTASNGVLSDPLSLHNVKEARNNQYLNALESLGSVIARYDPEQKVAAFGFGAKRSVDSPTDHCLQLIPNTWAKGIKGVSEAYHTILPSLTFAGPTYIAPILDKVMELANVDVTQEKQSYYVLLVITDGIINDMDLVVKKLVDASRLPMSVIILGVGPSDFTLMEQFHEASHAPLFDTSEKKTADRPNYHFSALKAGALSNGSRTIVVQNALAALSAQVLQYMKMRNITPGPPGQARLDPKNSWVDSSTVLEGEDNGDPLAFLDIPDNVASPSPTGSTSSIPGLLPAGSGEKGSGTDAWRKTSGKRANFQTGLHCPTCGSYIEPGSSVYKDVLKMS
ncbi:copine-1 [Aplysia californica]|uniref:Copine-1 n=1 Tax=Aplysia californica TaxID=6500 RepID=A0ABM0ZZW5_APLCA|nr:copine-1 [Aplysia californica]